jgi:hypothetical protein
MAALSYTMSGRERYEPARSSGAAVQSDAERRHGRHGPASRLAAAQRGWPRAVVKTNRKAAVLLLADLQPTFGIRDELSSADIVQALRALDFTPVGDLSQITVISRQMAFLLGTDGLIR